jgi:ribosomal protein L11 methyltransferase
VTHPPDPATSPDAPPLARLTVAVATADAPVAIAVLAPLLGGCREREVGDETLLDFWLRPGAAADREAVAAELAALGIAHRLGEVGERSDWMASIRAFHRPFDVGPLHVRPPWTPPDPAALDVVVDPGMAFGTGQHATTHGCLELLAARPRGSVLDVGCGSGILAIAAVRLGHAPVLAVDFDPDAVDAARANAAANGVAIEVALADAGREPLPAADLVLANITLTTLLELAGRLPDPPPAAIVASGVRTEEVPALAAGYAVRGFRRRTTVSRDGWSAVLLEREA